MPTGQDVQHGIFNTETELFTRRLNVLQEIVTDLLTDGESCESDRQMFEAELRNLECKLNKLAQNVAKEGSLNTGGKFEWIDSVLVKVRLGNEVCFNLSILLFSIFFGGGGKGHFIKVLKIFW